MHAIMQIETLAANKFLSKGNMFANAFSSATFDMIEILLILINIKNSTKCNVRQKLNLLLFVQNTHKRFKI